MFQKGKKSEKKNPNLHKLNPPFSLSKSFLSWLGDSASGSLAFLNIKLNNKYYKLVLPFSFTLYLKFWNFHNKTISFDFLGIHFPRYSVNFHVRFHFAFLPIL